MEEVLYHKQLVKLPNCRTAELKNNA